MLEQIIEWFGSKANMARALGVDRSAVTQWVKDGGLPAARAVEVERLSGGRFKAVDLARTSN
jgi:DNA-binding transcriptional regulator YdaS (Cro superfamily)